MKYSSPPIKIPNLDTIKMNTNEAHTDNIDQNSTLKQSSNNEATETYPDCERMVNNAKKSWKVQYLISSMENLGCEIPKTFFRQNLKSLCNLQGVKL